MEDTIDQTYGQSPASESFAPYFIGNDVELRNHSRGILAIWYCNHLRHQKLISLNHPLYGVLLDIILDHNYRPTPDTETKLHTLLVLKLGHV